MNETLNQWHEVKEGKAEFQNILKLLVDFDERTGRHLRYADQEAHWMRKALATSKPEHMRLFLRDLGGFVYRIVAQTQTSGGFVVSAYVHEDGIRMERDQESQGHPVHQIVCITDLFERSAPLDNVEGLGAFTIGLLVKSPGANG